METQSAQRLIRATLVSVTLVALVWLVFARALPARAAGEVQDCSFQGLANALNSGNGLITFNCDGIHASRTITQVQFGGLNVDNGVYWTIDGGDAITLTGSDNFRLFNVKTGGALTLSHIILAHGYVGNNQPPLPSQGGALLNNGGRLVLDHATVRDSQSVGSNATGGGIENAAGTTLVMDSLIANNQSWYGGGMHTAGTTTLQNVTFIGNLATGNGIGGGALYNAGETSITNGLLVSNSVSAVNARGGAIDNSGVLTVSQSTLSQNTASNTGYGSIGGGIYNIGWAMLIQVTLDGNSASSTAMFGTDRRGGGIYNDGMLTLNRSTLSGNSARNGAGLYNVGNATAMNSTLISNPASESGGGVLNNGVITLTNSTLSGNTAMSCGGMINHKVALLVNVTLSGNSAPQGGGLCQNSNYYVIETLTLRNTIIAYSPAGKNCYQDPNSVGSVISQGYNLSDDDSFGTTCPALNPSTDLPQNTDPNLGPLANNGGPTLTHMPMSANSPGIDRIPMFTNGCGTTLVSDQRGAPRPVNNLCDIGAVEYGAAFRWLWLPLIKR